jgi:hypothetical protein
VKKKHVYLNILPKKPPLFLALVVELVALRGLPLLSATVSMSFSRMAGLLPASWAALE